YFASFWMTKDPYYSQCLTNEVESNNDVAHPTLLDVLKAETFLLGGPREKKIPIAASDRSVQFYKAPTLMREVDILYRSIQDYLKEASTSAPGSIVVLAPDIERYLPYLESLFTHSS